MTNNVDFFLLRKLKEQLHVLMLGSLTLYMQILKTSQYSIHNEEVIEKMFPQFFMCKQTYKNTTTVNAAKTVSNHSLTCVVFLHGIATV